MSRHLRAAAAVAAAAVLGVAACTAALPGIPSGTPTTVTPQTPPPGTTGLDSFYKQSLAWKDCYSGDQCAWLTVPVDYADPSGATVRLAVLKAPATGSRKGALLFNPGGPGGSAVDYVAEAPDQVLDPAVRRSYDLIGLDPRGVGHSSPITCYSGRQLDGFLALDPTPSSPAEEQRLATADEAFAQACGRNAGALLAHVSTVDAARDMDILRATLGEPKLNYLGKSYGTFLGATYAGLFPTLVGRFVLDGVVPPELTNEQLNLGQAAGFELATRAWAASCVESGACPLGTTVEEVMQGLRDLLAQLDQAPLTKTGDPSVPLLTEGWASMGVGYAMYDQGLWAQLDDALTAVVDNHDGSKLMDMADAYADRKAGGTYTDNIMQVIYAVNCLDRPDTASLADHERQATEAEKVAPTWGKYLMWSSLPCVYWPVKATNPPHKITAAGSGLIVVIGTTRDPATPYAWSVLLHKELANNTLITYAGDGHTAYMRSNSCVDNAVDAYYTKGTPPTADLHC